MTGPAEVFPAWPAVNTEAVRRSYRALERDLQSEFATWLQCKTREARPAAFCELVGAVTPYVMTGVKPGLRAKLPPAELLA